MQLLHRLQHYSFTVLLLGILGLYSGSSAVVATENINQPYLQLADTLRSNVKLQTFLAKENFSQVQVIMFFNYACFWCSKVNTPFQVWKEQNPTVKTHILPIGMANKNWLVMSKVFFIVQTLEPATRDQIETDILQTLYVQRQPAWEDKILENIFVKAGVSLPKFRAAYNSFEIYLQSKAADDLAGALGVTSTPNFIVLGPKGMYTTSPAMASGIENVFTVLDQLILKAK